MSKRLLVLGLVCVALAVLDIKLLRDLHAVRAEILVGTQTPPPTSAAAEEMESTGNSGFAPGFTQASDSRTSEMQTRGPDAAQGRAGNAEYLKMFSDPRLRSQLIAEQGLDRRETLDGVDRALHITPDRWQMLNERLAELEIEFQELDLRCAGAPACKPTASDIALRSARSEQIVHDVLGAVKTSEFKAYIKTLQERRAVEGLQARLGDSPLTRERSEELIGVLHAEDVRTRGEWNVDTGEVLGYSYPGLGRVLYPRTATTSEQRSAAAEDYSRRLRERAAPLLNAEQRAAFDAMQDELLARLVRSENRRKSGG